MFYTQSTNNFFNLKSIQRDITYNIKLHINPILIKLMMLIKFTLMILWKLEFLNYCSFL